MAVLGMVSIVGFVASFVALIVLFILRRSKKVAIIALGLSVFTFFLAGALTMVFTNSNVDADGARYTYVEGVGWRNGGSTSFTKDEYLVNCADPLSFEVYDNNPEKYKGVMYAVTGRVYHDEIINADKNEFARHVTIIDDNGTYWDGVYYLMGSYGVSIEGNSFDDEVGETGYATGSKLTLYGEFNRVISKSVDFKIFYVIKR